MGLLSSGGLVTPKFSASPRAAKLCVRPQKFYRCKNVLEVLYTMPRLVGLGFYPAAGVAKNVEFFCLSVYLFITLLNV